jgi:hypothetical protein
MQHIRPGRGYADMTEIDYEDEPTSVALVPWSRGVLARRSGQRPVPRSPKPR